jgi:hypothetical protein
MKKAKEPVTSENEIIDDDVTDCTAATAYLYVCAILD